MCAPSGITDVERRAVEEAARSAGAREVHLIEEPLAAAIGADLPVAEAIGSFVVDVGGGTTELAVTALGGMVVSSSLQVGGYDFDDAIVRRVQQQHKLLVGQEQAEQVKIDVGSALTAAAPERETEIAGRDLATGMLRRISLEPAEVTRALERPVAQIVEGVKDLLEQTPAELSADVADRGLMLVGGGSLLRGFDDVLRTETGLAVTRDPEPLTTVARGAGSALEELGTGRGRGRR
jgi:rod shape-determining protein MreB